MLGPAAATESCSHLPSFEEHSIRNPLCDEVVPLCTIFLEQEMVLHSVDDALCLDQQWRAIPKLLNPVPEFPNIGLGMTSFPARLLRLESGTVLP